MDLGALWVDVLAGLVVSGRWLVEHPELALPAASAVTTATIGVALARGAIR